MGTSAERRVLVQGTLVEKAQKPTAPKIEKELKALSSTPYYAGTLSINVDADSFIQEKTIRVLKQEAVEKLNEKRLQQYKEPKVFQKPFTS